MEQVEKMSTSKLILVLSKCLLKENYDVDAVECDFKSEEKALALLPVPRNKRNCRRFGPYVTEKKLNDLKS